MPPHAQAFGIDQVPEALLLLIVLRTRLTLSGTEIVVLVAAFLVLEIWLSRLLFRLHLRDQPY